MSNPNPQVNPAATAPRAPRPAARGGGIAPKQAFWLGAILVAVSMIGISTYLIVRSFRRDGRKSKELVGRVVSLKSAGSTGVMVRSKDIPSSTQDFTYSAWVFLDQLSASNQYHLLCYRTDSATPYPQDASFLILADKATSRLIIKVKTRADFIPDTTVSATTRGRLAALVNAPDDGAFVTLEIPYVPLQRWVHLAVVSDGNVLTLYKDGDVYEVKLYNLNGGSPNTKFPALPQGMFVVGTPDDSDGPNQTARITGLVGFNAYMASVYFHTYPLSQHRVRVIYRRGPRNVGWFSSGFFGYRLRNPVYLPDYEVADE